MKLRFAALVAGLWLAGCGFFDFPAPERAPKERNDGGEAGTRPSGGGTSGASGMGGASGTSGAAGAGEGGTSGSTTGGTGGDGGGGAGPTEPLMPGLKLWLDAASLPGDGPLVTWPNRVTGGESDASQAADALKPELATFDGRRGVSFNGAQWMNFGEGFGSFSAGLTLFIVARFDAPGVCTEIFQVSNGLEMDDISLQTDVSVSDTGALLFEVENANLRTGPRVLDGSDPQIATVVVRPPEDAFIFVDSAPGAMQSDPFFVPDSYPRVENFLGSGQYLNCDPFEGVIFEFLLYNRGLSVEDVTLVNAYLQQKWECCGG